MLILTVRRGGSFALRLPDDRLIWVKVLPDRRIGVEAPDDVKVLRDKHLPPPQTQAQEAP